jgi:hypothetical protein
VTKKASTKAETLLVVEDAGAQALKGLERPIQVYRTIRPNGMRGRFLEAIAAGGLTPVVGCQDALADR